MGPKSDSLQPRVDQSRLTQLAAQLPKPRARRGDYRRPDRKGLSVPAKKAGGAGSSSGGDGVAPRAPTASKEKEPAVEGGQTAWAKRLSKEDNEWSLQRPAHSKALRSVTSERDTQFGHAALEEKKIVLNNMNHSCLYHGCCSPARLKAEAIADPAARELALAALYADVTKDGSGSITKTATVQQVVWCGMRICFVLDVWTFFCSLCNESFVPLAIHVLGFASSPSVIRENGKETGYTYWLALEVADDFARSRSIGKISAMAFAAAKEATYRLSCAALARLGLGDGNEVFTLDDRILNNVHFAYQRASILNTAVGERGLCFRCGIGQNCPSCSAVIMPNGTIDASTRFSIVMDATLSAGTNPSAAKAARKAGLMGVIHKFFISDACAASAGGGMHAGGPAAPGAADAPLPLPAGGPAVVAPARSADPPADPPGGGLSIAAAVVAAWDAAAAAARRSKGERGPAATGAHSAGAHSAGGDESASAGDSVQDVRGRLAAASAPSAEGRRGAAAARARGSARRLHNPLHCSRELLSPQQAAASAVAGAPSVGIVGTVCGHGQPLLEGFLNMKAPENWSMYDRLLRRMLFDNRVDRIEVVYIDFSCLYMVHFYDEFGAELKELASQMCGDGVSARCIDFYVDWLHMQGHIASCRYSNGAMYNEGTGRRIGVGAETLWSKVRSRWAGGVDASKVSMQAIRWLDFGLSELWLDFGLSELHPLCPILSDEAHFADVSRYGPRSPRGLARARAARRF